MAKTLQTKSAKAAAAKANLWNFPLAKRNYLLFAAGLGILVIGFLLMATAITDDPAKYQTTWNNPLAVSVAPLVLVIGYCIVIPYALMKRNDGEQQEN
ncbi:MAG: DUF3098 domain-containing protein [Ignavibacteriae bacterium]|nr:DUF3098 domain-containing protein [Ignavibacteriota bacterium]